MIDGGFYLSLVDVMYKVYKFVKMKVLQLWSWHN